MLTCGTPGHFAWRKKHTVYELDGQFLKDTFQPEIFRLREKLTRAPAHELRAYLQASATETSATAQVLRLLVTQALNVKAAEGRRAVGK